LAATLPVFPDDITTGIWGCRDAILPYQVRKGSLIIVAATAEDALVIFDSMEITNNERVTIQDMDGHKVDPETIRSSSKCTKPGPM
jgi:hypothetical protein